MFSSVQSLSRVWLFVTPWIAGCQASLSITNSWSSLKLTSIKSVMPSSHLILCHPLLLLPPIPLSIRVFSSESTLHVRWPKYWISALASVLTTSLVAQRLKRLRAMRETRVQSLGWEDPLEKEMATHSSTLAWKIPRTEEPGGPQSMGSQRVRHNWTTSLTYNEHPGQKMDWLDLLAAQGTFKSLLQHHSSKASILWHSLSL